MKQAQRLIFDPLRDRIRTLNSVPISDTLTLQRALHPEQLESTHNDDFGGTNYILGLIEDVAEREYQRQWQK